MTETPREPAPDGTSGTSFVDTSRLAERADIDESPAPEGAPSSHANVSLANADLPEPKLPPITSARRAPSAASRTASASATRR